MRKATIAALAILFLLRSVSAWGDLERLHPFLRSLVCQSRQEGVQFELLPHSIQVFSSTGLLIIPGESVSGKPNRIGVLVKTTSSDHTLAGLAIGIDTGTIVTTNVTMNELVSLANNPGIEYVEPAWRMKPKLDSSLEAIRVTQLPEISDSVCGEDVIIGAVDTGIDYSHLDFRYDNDGDGFEESSRIVSIWDQVADLYYDNEEIETDIFRRQGPGAGIVRQVDSDGHGTHVMGIAAGDGSASDMGLRGVAPCAQIVAVKSSFYTSDILNGVKYIFEQAQAYGVPAVVNLSLGGHIGPHDGTSLLEQGLDELVGNRPGRAIVVSAGNEGDRKIHISHSLSEGTYEFSVMVDVDTVDMDLWYPGNASCTLAATAPGGGLVEVNYDTAESSSFYSGEISIDNASGGKNPENHDNEIMVRMTDLLPGTWHFSVTDVSGEGWLNGWLESGNGAEFVDGDGACTIAEPGNASSVITAGAFVSKVEWESVAGDVNYSTSYSVGDIGSFSSRGPTRDGRLKPDIAAPGAWIASSLSADAITEASFTVPDRQHILEAGTSFAAPHVSGVVALMFSADPLLSSSQVKDLLTDNAAVDSYVGSAPNNSWGYGKLDAFTSVGCVLESSEFAYEVPRVFLEENPVTTEAAFHYTLSEGNDWGRLLVYSVAGRLVYRGELNNNWGTHTWGLATNTGPKVGNGLYIFMVVAGGRQSEIGRLVVAR